MDGRDPPRKRGDIKLKNWKALHPLRPRFGSPEYGSRTILDACQALVPKINAALQVLKDENHDVTAFTDVLAMTEFFLKKITVTLATPENNVEPNGEALQLLETILHKYKKLVKRFAARPKFFSSRTRRYTLSLTNIWLRQEARGAGEKNGASWSGPEKKESQTAALDEISIVEARSLWAKIQCADLGCVPWDHFFKLFEKTLNISVSPHDEAILKNLMTKTGVDYLRPSEFNNFLKTFDLGNLSTSCVQNAKQMWFSSGFYAWCCAWDAKKFLQFEEPGNYCLTLSASTRAYFELNVVTSPGVVQTWWIRSDLPNGVYASESPKQTDEAYYKSMSILLHQCNAVTPFISECLSEEGFYGDLSGEEITEMLATSPDWTYIISHEANKLYEAPEKPDKMNAKDAAEGVTRFFLQASYRLKDKIMILNIDRTKDGFRFAVPLEGRNSRRNSKRSIPKALPASQPGSGSPSGLLRSSDAIVVPAIQPTLGSLLHTRRDVLKYNFSFDNVPHLGIMPFLNSLGPSVDLVGPEKEKEGVLLSHKSHICAETIGGYPSASLGSILCDRFHVRCMGDRTIFCLADGCNWGPRSRTAAMKASLAFIEYMSDPKIQSESNTLSALKEHLLRSFRVAHARIIAEINPDEIWTIGQTTLLCGVMVPLLNNKNYKWGIVFFTVGDCKLFLYNEFAGARDLTYGNRANARNAKDTGGRLGPYVDGGQPDLRNLKSFFYPLETGDCFIAVSDGVYDNMDPETLGYSPSQLQIPFATWEEIPPDELEAIKDMFICQHMNDVIGRCKQKTPYFVARTLIKHGMETTLKSREFMEAHPNNPEPEDHLTFPGKMDHITAIVIRAGSMLEAQTNKEKKRMVKEEMKVKENFLKKTKDKPEELMFLVKKNSKSVVPKVTWKVNNKSVASSTGDPPHERKFSMKGPTQLNQMVKSSLLNCAGMTINTMLDDYDPPSEYFNIESVPKRDGTIAVFAANTVLGSSEPAMKITDLYMQCMLKNIELTKDTLEIADLLADATELCHKSLVTPNVYTSENALLLAAICLRHPEDYAIKTSKTFTILLVNVGNARAFYWDYLKHQLTELTPNNKTRDNGVLGPSANSDETPNFFKMSVYSNLGDTRGIVLFLSPGVCNVLDPYYVGKKIEDHHTTGEEIEEVTRQHRLKKITKLLKTARANVVSDHSAVILEYVNHKACRNLDYDDLMASTKSNDPRRPKLDKGRPGAYFGHASCVAFRVGPFQEEDVEERAKIVPPKSRPNTPRQKETKDRVGAMRSASAVDIRKLPRMDGRIGEEDPIKPKTARDKGSGLQRRGTDKKVAKKSSAGASTPKSDSDGERDASLSPKDSSRDKDDLTASSGSRSGRLSRRSSSSKVATMKEVAQKEKESTPKVSSDEGV